LFKGDHLKSRVVITGIGVVAPNGIGKEEFWQANLQGKSGTDVVQGINVSRLNTRIAAQIKKFDPLEYMSPKLARRTDRFVHLGLASARMALEDGRVNLRRESLERIGVVMGSGLGGIPFHEKQILAGYEKGIHRLNPLCVPRISPNAISGHISIEFGFIGPNIVISSACASGTHAIGQAFRMIQYDGLDMVLSGGAEAPLTEFTFGAYCALKVLSKRNDSPQQASRPFDKKRDGFVLGEGAAVLVLERLEHALRRNAYIYAEIIGYASNSAAYHMVTPVPDGRDAAELMIQSLKDANIRPSDVDYINAHGTSTKANDKVETKAIKYVFKDYAQKIPVSSTKSMIGHTVGAAGAIEAAVCCLTIKNNLIPPTINYKYPDPDCDLDYVPNEARGAKVDVALSNSFGFGGSNACLVFRRFR
jgi:3-oxoacyl-[acyl-carrier-protein] synthase II